MTADPGNVVHPFHIADARNAVRHVFIHDMVLPCSIGVYSHERAAPQRVRINLDLAVRESSYRPVNDRPCQRGLLRGRGRRRPRAIVGRGHMSISSKPWPRTSRRSVSRMSASCRFGSAIEKLDVFSDTQSVGVEIERVRR